MKKSLSLLIISLGFAYNSYSQDGNTSLRFIIVKENKIEAALLLNSIEKNDFETLKAKLELSGVYNIEADFIAETNFASFVLKSKSTASINDFENFIIEAKILQVVYNNILINSTQISENYKPISSEATVYKKK